jgi:hypothetical protein
MAVEGYIERRSSARWHPLWCVLRTAIICAVVAVAGWALDIRPIWPGVLFVALLGVWHAAAERSSDINWGGPVG